MKNKNIAFATCGILIGRISNRVLSSYFGDKGPLGAMFTIVILFFIYDLYLLVSRRFIAALTIFVIAFPLIIIFIGMYIDDLVVGACGLGSIFIVYPLLIKWQKGLDFINKNDLWNYKGRW